MYTGHKIQNPKIPGIYDSRRRCSHVGWEKLAHQDVKNREDSKAVSKHY
jgi:hypothetical protein